MFLSEKEKESIIRAELKRSISIERRWNRNEVSRESSDKEVNRRPISLEKFRADALKGPRVSIATGWNIKSGGREEYLVFLIQAVSAALPAEWDVECRYYSARVMTTVPLHPTSQVCRLAMVSM